VASGSGITDGCITQVDVSGGVPGYMYTINGNAATLPDCNLAMGVYDLCVTDNNGCSTCQPVQINECSLGTQTSFNEPTCLGACDGLVSVFTNGANGPTNTEWQDAGTAVLGNTETINNLCGGEYFYFITDSIGCEISGSVTIVEPNSITINTTILTEITTDAACLGEISAIAIGGHGSFNYQWYNCNEIVPIGNGPTISSLCPGEYYVIATDIQGCQIINNCDTIQKITSIDENELNSFAVFPNPSENVFTIETQITGEYIVRILDLSGKIVLERNVSETSIQFSSENEQLTQGVYFVEVNQENRRMIKRIVIQ